MLTTSIPNPPVADKLTDRERSAMWHARQRAARKGLPFRLSDELALYRRKHPAQAQDQDQTEGKP